MAYQKKNQKQSKIKTATKIAAIVGIIMFLALIWRTFEGKGFVPNIPAPIKKAVDFMAKAFVPALLVIAGLALLPVFPVAGAIFLVAAAIMIIIEFDFFGNKLRGGGMNPAG